MNNSILYLILAAVVSFTAYLWNDNQQMKERVNTAEAKIIALERSHAVYEDALNSAMKARETAENEARRKKEFAERLLKDNPDFDTIVLPDGVIRVLKQKGDGACDVPAAGNATR